MFFIIFICFVCLLLCSFAPIDLTVMTYDSYAVSEELIAQFEADHNAKIQFLQMGNAGATLSRAILTKNAPVADVLIGVDTSLLTRALENEVFEPYQSSALTDIPIEYQLDTSFAMLPFNYGDICINYDVQWFKEHALAVPETLDELTDPQYKSLLVTENPISSTPGMAFLMMSIAKFGEDGFIDYWKHLKENGLQITNDWSSAYYSNFSGSAGMGPQPMVVSYATSPAAEVLYAESELEEAPTASILSDEMCCRQVEFAGILKGTKNREMAEAFIDALLSQEWQNDLAMQMFVYPVNQNAVLPDDFAPYAVSADDPVQIDPSLLGEKRDEWLNLWDKEVLR